MHYRHGCIIVRGGKVIGQGYNDHRPGFNGGALKTGRIASSALDSPAVLALKLKLKKKRNQPDLQQHPTTSSTFTPYESMGGGGHLVNTPLSMHSEMAAIHSALTTCTKLSSSALSCEKPCFKLSGNSKRKARSRKEALEKYVERVCATSTATGKPQVQECGFEAAASQSGGSVRKQRQRQQVRVWVQGGRSAAQEQGWGVSGGSEWCETPNEREEEDERWRKEEREWSSSHTGSERWTTTTATAICV